MRLAAVLILLVLAGCGDARSYSDLQTDICYSKGGDPHPYLATDGRRGVMCER